jgi:hypothetical protein
MPAPYSEEFLVAVRRTVTIERLKRYLAATKNDLSQAMELYELNVQLCAILYGILHGLEIAVRNAEHFALINSYGSHFWYDRPPHTDFGKPAAGCEGPSWHQYAPLTPYWRDQVESTKLKPGVGNRPGKVIAELTFGFWVDLLQTQNHMPLWVLRKLNKAFPYAKRERGQIHRRLKEIQLLRNRISHHERIITSSDVVYNGNGYLTLDEIVECVEWVCPYTAQWLKTEFRFKDAADLLTRVAAMRITL